jgi:hypothetical protein
MENKKTENPSAFPALHLNGHDGMTLRDYFAAKIIQGLLSNSTVKASLPKQALELSSLSYQVADEMLKQREL